MAAFGANTNGIAGIGAISIDGVSVERPITYAEMYELKVAKALHGRLATPMQEGYDVIAGGELDGKTVQVKYSEEGTYYRKNTQTTIWAFNHNVKTIMPDFVVLIGRARETEVYWFAMTYFNFEHISSRVATGRFVQIATVPTSWRGTSRKGYWNQNKGWEFLTTPEKLYDKLIYLRNATQFSLFDYEP